MTKGEASRANKVFLGEMISTCEIKTYCKPHVMQNFIAFEVPVDIIPDEILAILEKRVNKRLRN